jgi:hypothetical protein
MTRLLETVRNGCILKSDLSMQAPAFGDQFRFGHAAGLADSSVRTRVNTGIERGRRPATIQIGPGR